MAESISYNFCCIYSFSLRRRSNAYCRNYMPLFSNSILSTSSCSLVTLFSSSCFYFSNSTKCDESCSRRWYLSLQSLDSRSLALRAYLTRSNSLFKSTSCRKPPTEVSRRSNSRDRLTIFSSYSRN